MNQLRRLREARRLTLKELAQRIGTTEVSLSRYEREERRLTLPLLRKLADALGTTIGEIAAEPTELVSARSGVVALRGEDYALIPVYDARMAAGPGAEGEDAVLYRILFRMQWLRSVTRAPLDRLAVIEIDGDSMEPALRSGDHGLLDLSQNQPRGKDGIYALRSGEGLQMKRVSAHPVSGHLTISSDNSAYPSYQDIEPSVVNILGRLIWIGRRL